jgi:hypothetical protein
MKLSSALLKKIIMEEVAKFGDMESTEDRADDTEEVGADEFGSEKVLSKKIDYIKALKIEETRLRQRLEKVVETRRRVIKGL